MDKPDEPKSVDLYWLVDDGGLSVLIPYLMVKTQYWRYRLGRKGMGNGGAIRIFLMTNSDLNEGAEAVGEEESLRQKLKEYRLDAVCTVSTAPPPPPPRASVPPLRFSSSLSFLTPSLSFSISLNLSIGHANDAAPTRRPRRDDAGAAAVGDQRKPCLDSRGESEWSAGPEEHQVEVP